MGATLVPMAAGRIGIVYARAKRQEPGVMLPLGFPLYETVVETASVMEQVNPIYYAVAPSWCRSAKARSWRA